MVAARNSAPTNVDECKGVNMHLNSDVSMNASTLAKEPVDTNEKTMSELTRRYRHQHGIITWPVAWDDWK